MEPFDVAVAFRMVIRRATVRDAEPCQGLHEARRSKLRAASFLQAARFVTSCGFRPPRLRSFPGELLSLFRAERSHTFSSAFASSCLAALFAHFAHDFGNKFPLHSSIL